MRALYEEASVYWNDMKQAYLIPEDKISKMIRSHGDMVYIILAGTNDGFAQELLMESFGLQCPDQLCRAVVFGENATISLGKEELHRLQTAAINAALRWIDRWMSSLDFHHPD